MTNSATPTEAAVPVECPTISELHCEFIEGAGIPTDQLNAALRGLIDNDKSIAEFVCDMQTQSSMMGALVLALNERVSEIAETCAKAAIPVPAVVPPVVLKPCKSKWAFEVPCGEYLPAQIEVPFAEFEWSTAPVEKTDSAVLSHKAKAAEIRGLERGRHDFSPICVRFPTDKKFIFRAKLETAA